MSMSVTKGFIVPWNSLNMTKIVNGTHKLYSKLCKSSSTAFTRGLLKKSILQRTDMIDTFHEQIGDRSLKCKILRKLSHLLQLKKDLNNAS